MKYNVCMASDFFYPNPGGVEEHIFNLSQCLLHMGHKVIVVTHSYKDRTGIRYMTNGLKVYYLPIKVFYNECILPTMIASVPLIRFILLREKINIVHGHSAFSALAHEVIFIGRLLGIKCIFTDHSLFGFADTSAIITNKFLEISLANINHCICVSHIGKENTVLRARVNHRKVSVIPNAIDTTMFIPRPEMQPKERIVIAVVGRLVYRKGIDLLAQVIIDMCLKYPKVDFVVGGSGPKMSILEEVRTKVGENRLNLLGSLDHSKVPSVLNSSNIFLNTSLTEAYCMAIVEAASSGLPVVTTKVGGIPEVLPTDLVYLTEPNVTSLKEGLEEAMRDLSEGRSLTPFERHEMVKGLYDWVDIAHRTEKVYETVTKKKKEDSDKYDKLNGTQLKRHLKRYLRSGVWPFLLVVTLVYLMLGFLDWFVPRDDIDIARDYPSVTKRNGKSKSLLNNENEQIKII